MDPLPANYIRLLHIEADIPDSPIRCRLVTTNLEAPPSYEALSYTWGSAEQTSTITCDDILFPVTQNLYDALQHLRDPEHERVMWIDAVCINQKNDEERTAQVGIMKDIYAKASRVVVWLGKETPEDKLAFSLIGRFRKLFETHGFLDLGPFLDPSYGFPPLTDPEWLALVRLYQRDWFSRIWVVQEATMARESIMICGSYSVVWKDISWIALALRNQGHLGPYPVQLHVPKVPGINSLNIIYYLNGGHKSQNKYWGLHNLLRLTRKYLSTDPRDKVFALLGIVTDPDSLNIKADYRLSVEDVYLSVAIHSLETQKDLEILGSAGMNSKHHNRKLPSWVPDWSHNNDWRSVFAPVARNKGMSVSADTHPTLSVSADKKILTVRGALIDIVSRLDSTLLIDDEDAQLDHGTKAGAARISIRSKKAFNSCLAFAEAAHKLSRGRDREESLWRTLCCDMTTQIPVQRAPAEFTGGWKVLRTHHQATKDDGSYDWTGIDTSGMSEISHHYLGLCNAIGVQCAGMKLCITERGYLGYVSNHSQIGDKICMLFGSCVPYILRENEEGAFTLVGECYIDGIMEGEAMRELDIESLSRDIELI